MVQRNSAVYCRQKLSWYATVCCVFYWLCVSLVNDILKEQDLKNIKSVKRCRDGMPKSMETR